MIGEVTQSNLHLLIPSKVSLMAEILVSETGISVIDAITHIYTSHTYEKLALEETKRWHLGPVDLYQEMISE